MTLEEHIGEQVSHQIIEAQDLVKIFQDCLNIEDLLDEFHWSIWHAIIEVFGL